MEYPYIVDDQILPIEKMKAELLEEYTQIKLSTYFSEKSDKLKRIVECVESLEFQLKYWNDKSQRSLHKDWSQNTSEYISSLLKKDVKHKMWKPPQITMRNGAQTYVDSLQKAK